MTRYRLRPIVSEWDGDDLWVAALPDGPITLIGGVGAIVIEILTEASRPKTEDPSRRTGSGNEAMCDAYRSIDDVFMVVRGEMNYLPRDARSMISAFLDDLTRMGILDLAEGGPSW